MIELQHDRLIFSFPEVHRDAICTIDFQRSIRVKPDAEDQPILPMLGRFPLRRIEDLESGVPQIWKGSGGIVLPMYQSESLWLRFDGSFPVALQLNIAESNAVSGAVFSRKLGDNPQDYLVLSKQRWLDGHRVGNGKISQFVSVVPGDGDSGSGNARELLLVAYPLKADEFEKWQGADADNSSEETTLEMVEPIDEGGGKAPGRRISHEVYPDSWSLDAWDTEKALKCTVRLGNSLLWRALTGQNPPQPPPNTSDYEDHGFPWLQSCEEPISGLKDVEDLRDKLTGSVRLPEPAELERARLNDKKGIVLTERSASRLEVSEAK